MTTITSTTTAVQPPFDDAGFDEAQLAAASFLARYSGRTLEPCESVATQLGATVWDVRCVKPLDEEMLRDAAAHRLVVTVEDGVRVGGVGMQIQDAIAGLDPSRSCPPVLILGLPSEFLPHGSPDQILSSLGLDAPSILAATESALSRLTSPLY